MTDLREAAQMALDALLQSETDPYAQVELSALEDAAIEALRAALAQPEQEPVAWWHDMGDVVDLNVSGRGTPLYTAPPQREWQGLTDEEKYLNEARSAKEIEYAKAIEAKLREKNA